ncbi:MAG: homoserine kinase, partial [Defluviitaleaceae bacterium]|nr:homoserine kinase [Defluviitaleaceae bacterium]
MMTIRVPATTANMGPGFDCTGMALNIYNELTAEESDRLSINITGGTSASMPVTKDNLIYTTISRTFARMGKPAPNLRITQKDSIPVARGLGSSAACIVAGLLAANELCGGGCSRDELARMACSIEGHPDNVVPAMLGGLVTGATDASGLRYVRIEPSDELSFALFIPSF